MARDTVDDKLRVGQVQRENAVSVLRDASSDGRLSFEELNERVPAALTAITRADLVRLLDDLVPEDWGVDAQNIMLNGQNASVSSSVRTRPVAGAPRIVLRGRTSGRVRVRHANYWDRRRAAKLDALAAAQPKALPPAQ